MASWFQRGLTTEAAAKESGIHPRTLHHIQRRRGIRLRRFTEENLERYLDCAARGMTKAETARALGVSNAAVTQIARQHHIVFTPGQRGRPKKGR